MPRATYEAELTELRRAVAVLGGDVDRQLERAMDALRRGDATLATAVRGDDMAINAAYAALELRVVSLIARQSPMAGDLRLALAVLATATELERIADHAADIAEVIHRGGDAAPGPLPGAMLAMAKRSRAMLRDALASFEHRDVEGARALAAADDEVDALETETVRALMERVRGEPSQLESAVSLVVAAHHLERVADRATNIGEQTIYAVSGVLDELNPATVAG